MLAPVLAIQLAAAQPAAACAPWHGGAVGYYPGTVESMGEKPIDTWIVQDPDGRLSGRYVLHEPDREVPGTLDPVGDAGCGITEFRWTDLYGTGLVRLHFYPERRCFEGAWGAAAINPALFYRACIRERVTS